MSSKAFGFHPATAYCLVVNVVPHWMLQEPFAPANDPAEGRFYSRDANQEERLGNWIEAHVQNKTTIKQEYRRITMEKIMSLDTIKPTLTDETTTQTHDYETTDRPTAPDTTLPDQTTDPELTTADAAA